MKYVCSVCAYTYDDDAEEIPFDELPDDWTCTVCTADKEFFEAEGATEPESSVAPKSEGSGEGEDDLHQLSTDDLRTTSSEIAEYTPIAQVGK